MAYNRAVNASRPPVKNTTEGLACHSVCQMDGPYASALKGRNPSLVSSFASNFSTDWTPRSGIADAKAAKIHPHSSQEVLAAGRQQDPLTNSQIDMDFEQKLLTLPEPLSFYSHFGINDLGFVRENGPQAPRSLQSIDMDEENLDFLLDDGKKVSESMPLFNNTKTKASIEIKNVPPRMMSQTKTHQLVEKRPDFGNKPSFSQIHRPQERSDSPSAVVFGLHDLSPAVISHTGFGESQQQDHRLRVPDASEALVIPQPENLADLHDSGVNLPRIKYQLRAKLLSKGAMV